MNEPIGPLNVNEFQDPLADFEPHHYKSELERVLSETQVGEMTATPFLTVRQDTTIREAIQTMSRRRTAGLLVMDGERLVGIFTERDVLERVAEQYERLATHPVSEVMTADPLVVYDSDPVAAAVAAMAIAGHRHVPVLRTDGTVSGVLGPIRVFEFLDPVLDA